MSKFVKDLVTDHLKKRLENVNELLVVNIVGMNANSNGALRRTLREKGMEIMVVKNSLARRATEGTALAPAFEGSKGTTALVWGTVDIVSLAKEVVRLAGDKQYAPFQPKGGVMDGAPLSADEVAKVSKWPTREEQISLLMGQILGPGARLASQLTSVGGALASQIKQCGDAESEQAAPEATT